MTADVLEVNCARPKKRINPNGNWSLKTDKAPVPGEIPATSIKADMYNSIEILHDLTGKIWDIDEIPAGWKEGYHVKTPKKEDLQ